MIALPNDIFAYKPTPNDWWRNIIKMYSSGDIYIWVGWGGECVQYSVLSCILIINKYTSQKEIYVFFFFRNSHFFSF